MPLVYSPPQGVHQIVDLATLTYSHQATMSIKLFHAGKLARIRASRIYVNIHRVAHIHPVPLYVCYILHSLTRSFAHTTISVVTHHDKLRLCENWDGNRNGVGVGRWDVLEISKCFAAKNNVFRKYLTPWIPQKIWGRCFWEGKGPCGHPRQHTGGFWGCPVIPIRPEVIKTKTFRFSQSGTWKLLVPYES